MRLFTEPTLQTIKKIKTKLPQWNGQHNATPDLNIIEIIWLYMQRELQKSVVNIGATKNDLLREIQSVWRNIELNYKGNLYQSIPDRLDNVMKMRGHLTKYKGDRIQC